MPTLPSLLIQQAKIPANIEASMPVLPKISGMLAQFAAALPAGAELPAMPNGMATAAPFGQGITQVIKGVEDAMPAGIPKFSESISALTMGGYRPVEVGPAKSNGGRRIMGSGYRSI